MNSKGKLSSLDIKRREFNSEEINVITSLECLQVIRQTLNLDNFEVIDYTIENVDRDVLGFLGEYFRLKIIIKNVSKFMKFNGVKCFNMSIFNNKFKID